MEGRGHNTWPRCGNQVRRAGHAAFSSCVLILVCRDVRRPSGALRVRTSETKERQGHPTGTRVRDRVVDRSQCGRTRTGGVIIYGSRFIDRIEFNIRNDAGVGRGVEQQGAAEGTAGPNEGGEGSEGQTSAGRTVIGVTGLGPAYALRGVSRLGTFLERAEHLWASPRDPERGGDAGRRYRRGTSFKCGPARFCPTARAEGRSPRETRARSPLAQSVHDHRHDFDPEHGRQQLALVWTTTHPTRVHDRQRRARDNQLSESEAVVRGQRRGEHGRGRVWIGVRTGEHETDAATRAERERGESGRRRGRGTADERRGRRGGERSGDIFGLLQLRCPLTRSPATNAQVRGLSSTVYGGHDETGTKATGEVRDPRTSSGAGQTQTGDLAAG